MSICPEQMSYCRPSTPIDLVSPVTACLVDVYATDPGRGTCAEIEPLLMIRPPCGVWSRIMRNAVLAHRNIAFRFTCTTRSHIS